MHRDTFESLYKSAGLYRTVATGKGGSLLRL
jgi:hypothetical protein